MCTIAISCDNDETDIPNEESATTELFGTWNYLAYIDDIGEELATECEKNQTITFEESGVFYYTYFDDYYGTCTKTQVSQGTFEFISESLIKTDYTYGNYVDRNKFENRFEISGNILTLYIDEGEGEYQERYIKE